MNVFVSYLAWLVKFPILLRFIGYISDKIIGFIPCELDTVIESNHFIYLDLSPYNYISHSFAKRLSYRDNAKIIYVLPSWDNLYKWHTHLFYDKYLVWGDSQKDFFKKLQIHPCKLETFGGPNVWNLFNKIISAPRTTKILYTSVSEKLFPGEKDFILQLIGMIQKNLFGDDVKLLVRLHPYDFSEISDFPIDDRIEIKRSNYSKDTLNWVVPNYFYLDLINDLENCKLVICMASSITLDAVLYGRIVLNIQDDNLENDYYSFNHYTPISTSGTIPIVKISDNELLQQEINNFISMDIHQYEAEVNNQRVGVSKVVDFEKDKTFFFELIKNLN
jgi:hypothetical protein